MAAAGAVTTPPTATATATATAAAPSATGSAGGGGGGGGGGGSGSGSGPPSSSAKTVKVVRVLLPTESDQMGAFMSVVCSPGDTVSQFLHRIADRVKHKNHTWKHPPFPDNYSLVHTEQDHTPVVKPPAALDRAVLYDTLKGMIPRAPSVKSTSSALAYELLLLPKTHTHVLQPTKPVTVTATPTKLEHAAATAGLGVGSSRADRDSVSSLNGEDGKAQTTATTNSSAGVGDGGGGGAVPLRSKAVALDGLPDEIFPVIKVNMRGRRQNRLLKLTADSLLNIRPSGHIVSSTHPYDDIFTVTAPDTETVCISFLTYHEFTYLTRQAIAIVTEINRRLALRRAIEKQAFAEHVHYHSVQFQEKLHTERRQTIIAATAAVNQSNKSAGGGGGGGVEAGLMSPPATAMSVVALAMFGASPPPQHSAFSMTSSGGGGGGGGFDPGLMSVTSQSGTSPLSSSSADPFSPPTAPTLLGSTVGSTTPSPLTKSTSHAVLSGGAKASPLNAFGAVDLLAPMRAEAAKKAEAERAAKQAASPKDARPSGALVRGATDTALLKGVAEGGGVAKSPPAAVRTKRDAALLTILSDGTAALKSKQQQQQTTGSDHSGGSGPAGGSDHHSHGAGAGGGAASSGGKPLSQKAKKLQQLLGTTEEQRIQSALDKLLLDPHSEEGKARTRFIKNFIVLERKPHTCSGVVRQFMDSLKSFVESKRSVELNRIQHDLKLERRQQQQQMDGRSSLSVNGASGADDPNQPSFEQRLEESIERSVLMPVYTRVVNILKQQTSPTDQILIKQIRGASLKSQSWFGVKPEFMSITNWSVAVFELSRLDKRALPCEKLNCLLQTARAIYNLYNYEKTRSKIMEAEQKAKASGSLLAAASGASTPVPAAESDIIAVNYFMGAEEFFPIFVFVVSQSRIEHPELSKQYMWQLCERQALNGEAGYYLTVFEAALEYLKTLDLTLASADLAKRQPTLNSLSGGGSRSASAVSIPTSSAGSTPPTANAVPPPTTTAATAGGTAPPPSATDGISPLLVAAAAANTTKHAKKPSASLIIPLSSRHANGVPEGKKPATTPSASTTSNSEPVTETLDMSADFDAIVTRARTHFARGGSEGGAPSENALQELKESMAAAAAAAAASTASATATATTTSGAVSDSAGPGSPASSVTVAGGAPLVEAALSTPTPAAATDSTAVATEKSSDPVTLPAPTPAVDPAPAPTAGTGTAGSHLAVAVVASTDASSAEPSSPGSTPSAEIPAPATPLPATSAPHADDDEDSDADENNVTVTISYNNRMSDAAASPVVTATSSAFQTAPPPLALSSQASGAGTGGGPLQPVSETAPLAATDTSAATTAPPPVPVVPPTASADVSITPAQLRTRLLSGS